MRNLGFRSVLFEGSALLEVNFFKYRGLAKDNKTWTPFVFAGLAYFHTNPQNLLNDTWYDLQPLGTEGQGTGNGAGYSLNQICIPFGVGVKLALTAKFDLQVEWGLRRTYTDYIDDVSGTYVAEVAPGSTERFNKTGFRQLAVYIETPGGPHFVKLLGPAATVAKTTDAFTAFLKSARY